MKDQYHINTEKYSLQKFKENLQSRDMIPSRVALKEDLDTRFQALESAGITNLKDLLTALKTKTKIEQFSQSTGLSSEYLTLLNREAKSYLPNPVRLDKFSGVESEVIEKLAAVGIKNSRHLFTAARDKAAREQLSKTTKIPIETLSELVSLADLSRVYGVGPVFARMIYDVGIHSIRGFTNYTAAEFIKIYEKEVSKKADFGVGEIEFSLEIARELELAVEL